MDASFPFIKGNYNRTMGSPTQVAGYNLHVCSENPDQPMKGVASTT
jgi:hypothetical protein